MLSFGPWVERVCSELLSSICYEDRFFGELNVTRKTSNSSILTWRSGPGNITHYRVEVTEGDNMLKRNFTTEDLTFDLNSLTPGTRYSIQVFAVKCTRDLNPQEDTFYTTPNKVEDLKFTNVSETSVFLNWTKPAGNLDFYLIKIKNGKQISSKTEGKEVRDLIPGNFYTFTVLSGVGDNSTWSEESIVSRNTKPGRVSALRVSRNTHHSLQLNWKSPVGNVSFFRVVATINNKPPLPQNVTITEVNITGLPIGSKITLSVTALVNGNIEGDSVTIDDYTAPGPIQYMNLASTDVSLNASWKTEGDSSSFVVELLLEGKVDQKLKTNVSEITFTGLKTAAEYDVTVYAFNERLNGEPLTRSIFTMPSPPTNAKSTYQDKSSITFEWDPPAKVGRVTYAVGIISSFWGHAVSERIENKTTHTFTGLKSGTKYDFQVQTVADKELSTAATVSHCTDADKREISLSMMCSSAEPLLCDGKATRDSVFEQLRKHFNEGLLHVDKSTRSGSDRQHVRLMESLQQCQRECQEVNLMLHTVTQVRQQDDRRWIESSEFCLQLNSSLAVIRDPAEMEFIQGVMRRFPLFPFLWVGLTDAQQEGLWLWGDGGDVQPYMPVTVEWDAEDRDRADLRGAAVSLPPAVRLTDPGLGREAPDTHVNTFYIYIKYKTFE
ncbi:hypothetical protein KUCAC02_000204 [Chaenocephalus aceratus]|uniref:Uncharacterized protein n=1 Tax=Chaenocephalus aceratus TaxID=36190 RepID=A0ACB9W4S4_CHAAC|nr:hypothetical protein KUCAC02_000204 [Chaenocephalus aceratus]